MANCEDRIGEGSRPGENKEANTGNDNQHAEDPGDDHVWMHWDRVLSFGVCLQTFDRQVVYDEKHTHWYQEAKKH